MRKQESGNVTLSEESVTLMMSHRLLYRGNGFQLINSVFISLILSGCPEGFYGTTFPTVWQSYRHQ